MVGEVIKTTPDAFYINDGVERAFTTTGAYVKETQRPTVLIKDTNRQCTSANEYTGVAEAMTNKQATHRSMIKQSTRQNYYTDINILDIQVNKWSLTWLTQLFRNRLIQPLKLNRLHYFDSNLVNVSGKSGVNNFYFQGLK